MKQFLSKSTGLIKNLTSEIWLIAALVIIAALAHGINMFHYPYFENDEATYVSQAWSFIHDGKLAPYTYYYDHAPAGWMLLGIWFFITGGLTTFGQNPLVSGRVFIFILHLFSVIFLYFITKKVTRQKLAAALSVLVFSLSPLELYYGRRVLLDNIMVFWLLASLFLATRTPQRILYVVSSAVTFVLAALSKENALFIAPALVYIVHLYSNKRLRLWSVMQWIVVSISLLLLYPLYALLKGELFPPGMIFGGTTSHVSLIQTIFEQATRGTSAFPWEKTSEFYTNFVEWVNRDPFLIIVGTICLLASMVLNEKYREIKAIALTAVAEVLFLARGKLVFDFYILSVIPLLSMMIGIMIARPVVWAKDHISLKGYAITMSFILTLLFITSGTKAFTTDETTNQQKAIDWIRQNVSKNAYVALNNYAYPELHDVLGYTNSDYSFKMQYDPSVKSEKYDNNPLKIQYILLSHTEVIQMANGQLPFINTAFNHSELVADYRNNTSSYLNLNKLISTNGDWAQVYKVDSKNAGALVDSWRNYKRNFITDSGQVIDVSSYVTTSEGQSYALLRSETMNDKVEFDRVWNWTRKNMQVRPGDSLFSWKITLDEQGNNHIADQNSAADADEDIAIALYNAYKKWGDKTYLKDAQSIANSIWNKEVKTRNNTLYLVSGADNQDQINFLINPSYLAPYNYKLFAEFDKSHNWNKLVTDSYSLLAKLQKQSSVGLLPNWILIDRNGEVQSASHIIFSADSYGFDAFRVTFRMSQDKTDKRAQGILGKLAQFYETFWKNNNFIATEFDMSGKPTTDYSDIATSAGAVIGLQASGNEQLAKTIYIKEIASTYNNGSWGKETNYYNQNWASFAVANITNPQNSKGGIALSKAQL